VRSLKSFETEKGRRAWILNHGDLALEVEVFGTHGFMTMIMFHPVKACEDIQVLHSFNRPVFGLIKGPNKLFFVLKTLIFYIALNCFRHSRREK